MIRYAAKINSLTALAINHVDTIGKLDTIKLCVAYKKDGKLINYFPASLNELAKCEPVYETFEPWKEDISNIKKYDELPDNAKKYLTRIEEIVGVKIGLIGVGKDREQIIVR